MTQQFEEMLRLYEAGAIDRRHLLAGLTATAVGLAVRPPAAHGRQAAETFRGRVVNHVTIGVSDINRSREFYGELLGATPNYSGPDGTDMLVGDSFIGVYQGIPPGTIHHLSVGVDDFEPEAALARLRERHAETEPLMRVNRKGEQEVYLNDPDGARVQISAADYGLAPWRASD